MSILMEGGDTRKRKIAFIEEEDEDEDIKIEKFFALIRSAKDIRDQLLDVDGSKPRTAKKAVTVTAKAKTAEKKAEVTQRVDKKPLPSSASAKEKIPIADAGVSATMAALNDSGSGGSSSSARNCRTEEQNNCNNKGGADYKNNDNNNNNNNSYQQGRIFLDLNLNLSL